MNFDGAKENIQPLAAGRNVEQLEVALNAESQHEYQEELLEQRRQYELAISQYAGDDPLELWFEYIGWVEQSYPKSGKESALDDLLKKCLSKFEKDSRYAQDPRFIRLFIKYIDSKKSPNLYYTKLYNSGVGTMVADLYIAWAHYFDVLDDFEQAKAVYQKGLDARAAPIEHLKQIYERFQFSVGQRVVRKEEYRQEFLSTMEAQRNAFTSLHSLKRSKVGSIRTGSAVKSFKPGQVRQNQCLSSSSSSNAPLKVYDGVSSQTPLKPPTQPYRSVVEEIENSMVENKIEPGPWSKPSSTKGVFHNVHGNSTLKFAILEDDIEQPPIKFGPLPPDSGNLAINLPKNFVKRNAPQTPFDIAPYVDDAVDLRTIPAYNKFYLHPNAKVCFQPEELRYYSRLKRRNISNEFTESRAKYWEVDSTIGVRIPPNFARHNQPQTDMETERPDISSTPSNQQFECNLEALYPYDSPFELQFEENKRMHQQINRNSAGEMDETVCVRGRQSFGVKHTRKSIASGGRKSIMPVASDREFSIRKIPPMTDDSSSDMDVEMDIEDDIQGDGEVPASALVGKVDEFLKPTALPIRHNKTGEFAKPVEPTKSTQWSVFNDDEPNGQRTPEEMAIAGVQSPAIFSSKSFGSGLAATEKSSKETFAPPQISLETVQSPAIFSSKSFGNGVAATEKSSQATFAIPQIPRTVEKRATEMVATKHFEPPPVQSPYPIGPMTGAVRKSILRKSTISEHAIESTTNHVGSSRDNAAKSQLLDLDYSLCTQAFNVNLAEQMVSTPVAIRRTEPLTEQIRAQDIQPVNPLKLSTIMETTEGSASSAASTKSSTQFSSPEDCDLSKRSNVTNRTKLVGTTGYPDDETIGARENYSRSEPMQEFSVDVHTKTIAGLTNYSCNVEKTLPTIQLSLLPDATPVVPYKCEATTVASKDGPTKNYPFPIFEDTQTASPNASVLPKMDRSEVRNRNASAAGHQFNETSMWIKDEPKSFSLNNNSAADESFALPMAPRETSAPLLGTTVSETYNNFKEIAHQSGTDTTDESFTLPILQKRKSIAPTFSYGTGDKFVKPQSQADPRMHLSTTEESFALPNVQPPFNTTVSETCNNFEGFESPQFKKEPQMDNSTTDESFTFPILQKRKSMAPAINQIKSESETDVSTTDESFALPNAAQQVSVASTTFDVDDSGSEEEIIEVPDDTLIDDVPKIVNVQSLAKRNGIGENRFDVSTRISISFTDEEVAAHVNRNDGLDEQSIYFKNNSISVAPSWMEHENETRNDATNRNAYRHEEVNLEESRIVIDTKLAAPLVDPFNEVLRQAILDNIQFMDFLKKEPTCDLIETVPTVTAKRTIMFKDTHFDVLKCIGHGAYGRVYSVKSSKDGSTYAVKKEMPANMWEYYIVKEVHSRVAENLSGYMRIDMSVIANNGSLLYSQYSPHGTLLDVCNRIFSSINSTINESIVFILAYQMLDLVDRLHKADILHLDLKPDNFLVMKPMTTNHRDLFIQLIDFGNAVDLRQYPAGQKFNAALETKHFVCLEMLEGRPWIFQPDLYCLAATVHSVLFGKYLEVRKDKQNYRANLKIPRYFHAIWSSFFDQLIDTAESSPNLQELKDSFEEVIIKDSRLQRKVDKFNEFIN